MTEKNFENQNFIEPRSRYLVVNFKKNLETSKAPNICKLLAVQILSGKS